MLPEVVHSLVLIISIAVGFVLPKTPLAHYDLQIIALLFLVLFLSRKYIRARASRLIESVIFTLVILFVINTTGGLESSFFFLLYFLIFSLTLLLEPVIAVTTSLTLIVFFILNFPAKSPIQHLLPAFSLAFLTPFALFMGKEHMRIQRKEQKINNLEKTLGQNTENTFLFLSLMIKNQLKSMREAVDNFLGDHDLHTIRRHIRNIEQLIDTFENNNPK